MSDTERRRALIVLWWLQCLSMGAMELTGPFWPLYLRELGGLSAAQLSLASGAVYAGPLLAAMVAAPTWGRLGDRVGHRPMLLRALLALAVTQAVIATTSSVLLVVLARLAQGACAGVIAAAQAYAVGISDGRPGSAIGRLQSATAIGSVAGPLLGGLALDHLGFRPLFWLTAAACAACALVAARRLPHDAPATAAGRREAAAPSPLPVVPLLALCGLIVLIQSAKMMPQVFFSLYVESVFAGANWFTGVSYAGSALGLTLAAPWWGRHFDRLHGRQATRHMAAVAWACAATLVLHGLVHDPWSFLALRVLWGIWLAALLPVAYVLIVRQVAADQHGAALGLGNGAAKLGGLTGVGLATAGVALLGVSSGFWLMAAIYGLTALGLQVLARTRR